MQWSFNMVHPHFTICLRPPDYTKWHLDESQGPSSIIIRNVGPVYTNMLGPSPYQIHCPWLNGIKVMWSIMQGAGANLIHGKTHTHTKTLIIPEVLCIFKINIKMRFARLFCETITKQNFEHKVKEHICMVGLSIYALRSWSSSKHFKVKT